MHHSPVPPQAQQLLHLHYPRTATVQVAVAKRHVRGNAAPHLSEPHAPCLLDHPDQDPPPHWAFAAIVQTPHSSVPGDLRPGSNGGSTVLR
jgi:hypothetical protein